jgi:hypothetical protein
MMPVTPSGGLMVLLHGQVVRWPVLISGSVSSESRRDKAESISQLRISLRIHRTEKGSICRQ